MNRMKRGKWKSLFTVEQRTVEIKEEVGSFLFRRTRIKKVEKWAVVSSSGDVVGLYDDHKYASSRARYFYKKFMKGSEKILLGLN